MAENVEQIYCEMNMFVLILTCYFQIHMEGEIQVCILHSSRENGSLFGLRGNDDLYVQSIILTQPAAIQ